MTTIALHQQDLAPEHPHQPFCWALLDTQLASPPIIFGARTARQAIAAGRNVLPLVADPIVSDAAGQPKLMPTFLENQMAQALNSVQAWLDASRGTPFPEELDSTVRALLLTYEARRK